MDVRTEKADPAIPEQKIAEDHGKAPQRGDHP